MHIRRSCNPRKTHFDEDAVVPVSQSKRHEIHLHKTLAFTHNIPIPLLQQELYGYHSYTARASKWCLALSLDLTITGWTIPGCS